MQHVVAYITICHDRLIADNHYKLTTMDGAEERDGANDLGALKDKKTQGLNYRFPCTPSSTSVLIGAIVN